MGYAATGTVGLSKLELEKALSRARENEDNVSKFMKRIILDYIDDKLSYTQQEDIDLETEHKKIKFQIDKERLRKFAAEATIAEHHALALSTTHEDKPPSPEAKKALTTHAKLQSNENFVPNFDLQYFSEVGEYRISCKLDTVIDPDNKISELCDFKLFGRNQEELKSQFLKHAATFHNASLYKSKEELKA